MSTETISVSSVSDFIDHLFEYRVKDKSPMWFRGQSNSEWSLQPRLMRISSNPPEDHLINRFKQNASLLLPHAPRNSFEWLFIMQHHSYPTRLLDWSESPLVALYFAVDHNFDLDGALWCLLPTKLNKMNRYESQYSSEIPSFEDLHLANYSPEAIAGESRISYSPMAAIAPRNSARMQAQQGVFTIFHRDKIPLDEIVHNDVCVWSYRIPAECKVKIKKQLEVIGISRFQLFPELESLSFQPEEA